MTTPDLPLYDTLLREITDVDLTTAQKTETIKNIKKIDTAGHELLYVLIKIYEHQFPFNNEMKQTKNDIKIDLEKLPNRLKQIIHRFSVKHLQRMEDEIRLNVQREPEILN